MLAGTASQSLMGEMSARGSALARRGVHKLPAFLLNFNRQFLKNVTRCPHAVRACSSLPALSIHHTTLAQSLQKMSTVTLSNVFRVLSMLSVPFAST